MRDFDRRDFLRGSTIAAAASTFGLLVPPEAQSAPTLPSSSQWDAGRVRHLLPTVSDSRVLVKASFHSPLTEAPMLRVGSTTVRGRMSDTRGEFWQFHAADLKPGRPYTLALVGNRGRALCEPWSLATFPAADESRRRSACCSIPARAAMRRLVSCPPPCATDCCAAPCRFSPRPWWRSVIRSIGICSRPRTAQKWARPPRRNESPENSTARRWCSGAIMRPC